MKNFLNTLGSWGTSPSRQEALPCNSRPGKPDPSPCSNGLQDPVRGPELMITQLSLNSVKESEAAQSCLTLCNPMDCSLPGSPVHGIFQARVLESVAISFSRGSSQARDPAWVSPTVGRCFAI